MAVKACGRLDTKGYMDWDRVDLWGCAEMESVAPFRRTFPGSTLTKYSGISPAISSADTVRT